MVPLSLSSRFLGDTHDHSELTLTNLTRMTHIIFIQLGLAVGLTAIWTAIACYRQIARKTPPSSGAVYGGAFGAAAVAVMISVFQSVGVSGFSPEFWANPALPGVEGYFLQWVVTGLVCLVPAAFVAAKLQRKVGW